MEIKPMNLVFGLDGVICTIAHPSDPPRYDACLPLANVTEFMQWLKKKKHHITIWSTRLNDLASKIATEKWLELNQIPYDRLLFDRPSNPIFVDETPPNSKYYTAVGDNNIITMLFEEWKGTLC